MSRIFISHSSSDNKSAEQTRDWLVANGWNDIFLDVDPTRGLSPGERWQNALKLAADRCEAVLFLISPNWLSSRWCLSEFLLAKQLGKRLFPVIIGDIPISDLPLEMSADHQVVDVISDIQGWEKLKQGLKRAGLDADSFVFPTGRRIYPGFEPLTEEDAAIFFGRDAQILRGLDRLRLMRDAGAERMMVIVGASGAGKSSFLRAGLWPRLRRDDRNFWPLPVIRPERAAVTGRSGLYAAFEVTLADPRISAHPTLASFPKSRAALGEIISEEGLAPLMAAIRLAAAPLSGDASSPTLVLCIDQAEELLNEEGAAEAGGFVEVLAAALKAEPHLLVIMSIRSDAYPSLQMDPRLTNIPREPFDLPPMPEGSLRSVIEGPARLASPPLKLEASLIDALLADAKGQDALPLMAFTLNRLMREYGADHQLNFQNYVSSGGVRGAITAAVNEALVRARTTVGRDEVEIEVLLRKAFVPHLARVNEAGEFSRRIALLTEIPEASRKLVDLLVEARLLIRDQTARGEIIEVAHEALLREWPLLRKFLDADRDFLVGKRQLVDDLAIWREASTERKPDALLSGLRLTRAQQWLFARELHELSDDERAFIRESIQAAQAKQRWRARLAMAAILLLAVFSVLAAWQWTKARHEATVAEQNAQEAKEQKERADQSVTEARAQKDIAEQQTLLATQQAARSEARADLIQSQFILKDAPQEALSKAVFAAKRLDSMNSGDEAMSLLSSVVNSARELPRFKPYSHFDLGGTVAFARQPPPKNDGVSVSNEQPYTVIVSNDISGVIGDDGKAAGSPFGSSETDGGFTNDTAWLDDGSFVVAQGQWVGTGQTPAVWNAGLRRRTRDGRLTFDYLPDYKIPVLSVAIMPNGKQNTLVAGDASGNLIVIGADEKANVISTGRDLPINRIIPIGESVVVVFGKHPKAAPEAPASTLDKETQRRAISSALGSSIKISYFGDNPSDEIGCASGSQAWSLGAADLYLCDHNSVTGWMGYNLDGGRADRQFTAHTAPVSAIALSPDSLILATGSVKGELRIWSQNGVLLADLPTLDDKPITALGFIDGGRTLLSASQFGLRQWDISDLANEISPWTDDPKTSNIAGQRQKAWVQFSDQDPAFVNSSSLESLIETNRLEGSYSQKPYGPYLISGQPKGARLIDARTATLRDVNFVEPPPEKDRFDFENTVIADKSGKATFVLTGLNTRRGSSQQSTDSRRIFAIENATGNIIAEWDLPEELRGARISIAASLSQERVNGWIGGNRDIFVLSPVNKTIQHLRLPESVSGEIAQVVPRDDSAELLVLTSTMGAQATTASLLQIPPPLDAPNNQPSDAKLVATTLISAKIGQAAISADGSRIAFAVSGSTNRSDVEHVRVFDRRFNRLVDLPGAPFQFEWFQLSSDGRELRATDSSSIRYSQHLSVSAIIGNVTRRLELWAAEKERAAAYKIGTTDKNFEKAKASLVEGVAHNPTEPQLVLILANKTFYSAKDQNERNEAMELYDRTNAADPYNPIAHYMRGKARATVGNYGDAIDDFSQSIVLPHILPQVQLVSGINTGISKLSYELNLQSRAELFLRRAMARAAIADWRLLVDEDLHWKHLNAKFYTLDYEMEGTALENLGNFSEALADFEQAAKQVTDSMPYELWRDVGNARKDPVWRSYQTAVYQKKIGNIYRKMSRQDEAKDAYDKADELIRDASAASDLSPDSRELLKQFSTAPPEQRCEAESELRSLHANISTQIAVSNQHGAPVRLYWLDSSGQRKFYRTIEQGAVSFQPTYENHPWILTDSDGGCLAILVPDSIGQMRYVVD